MLGRWRAALVAERECATRTQLECPSFVVLSAAGYGLKEVHDALASQR